MTSSCYVYTSQESSHWDWDSRKASCTLGPYLEAEYIIKATRPLRHATKKPIQRNTVGLRWGNWGTAPQAILYSENKYRKISNIWRKKITKFKCSSPHLAVVLAQAIDARHWVENEDVVGAAPTGDAPTTFEWSTNLSPPKVRIILENIRWYTIYDTYNKKISGSNRCGTPWPPKANQILFHGQIPPK